MNPAIDDVVAASPERAANASIASRNASAVAKRCARSGAIARRMIAASSPGRSGRRARGGAIRPATICFITR